MTLCKIPFIIFVFPYELIPEIENRLTFSLALSYFISR